MIRLAPMLSTWLPDPALVHKPQVIEGCFLSAYIGRCVEASDHVSTRNRPCLFTTRTVTKGKVWLSAISIFLLFPLQVETSSCRI